MNCGDIVYRSSLDPVLRMEQRGITPQGVALVTAAISYSLAKPSILQGAIDTYILAPLQQLSATPYCKEDFEITRKIAAGGFGVVYRAEMLIPAQNTGTTGKQKKQNSSSSSSSSSNKKSPSSDAGSNNNNKKMSKSSSQQSFLSLIPSLIEGIDPRYLGKDRGNKNNNNKASLPPPTENTVILKRAVEFGQAEVYMNERLMRAAPDYFAEFMGAFAESSDDEGGPLWLVWKYEGNFTLAELMCNKNFPANMESMMCSDGNSGSSSQDMSPARRAAVVRELMRQILSSLEACHAAAIVHRDVKPQNLIFAEKERKLKFVDLGAAADLRVGINYIPNQYLLDPRYAPPQQYIMSSQTPKAPPAPVAALLAPVLWGLECPDRFDCWSAGVILLQLAFPSLRTDNALIAFNKTFGEQYNWDIVAWRRVQEGKNKVAKEMEEGFATLDADGGAGWDLLVNLMKYEPRERLSASAALNHRWFSSLKNRRGGAAGGRKNALSTGVQSGMTPIQQVASSVGTMGKAAVDGLSSVDDDGWLTEVMLREELGEEDSYYSDSNSNSGGGWGWLKGEGQNEKGSATMVWWKQRQSDLEKRRKRIKVSELKLPLPLLGNKGGKGEK
jgi:serine/threonine protein kinase